MTDKKIISKYAEVNIILTEKEVKDLLISLNNFRMSFSENLKKCIGYKTTVNLMNKIEEQFKK